MDVVKGHAEYRKIAGSYTIPLHLTPEWLDALSPRNWDSILILNKDTDLLGLIVYSEYQKGPFRVIKMPPLTTYSGPFLNYPSGMKMHNRRSFEKQIMNLILENLPPVHFYYQQWLPEVDNWLPWMWKNYRQTTLYTYRISPQDPQELYPKLRGNVRTDLNKARTTIQVSLSDNLTELFELVSMSYANRDVKVPFSWDQLKSLDVALKKTQKRKIYAAHYQGKMVSAIYMAYDHDIAYYLTGGLDRDFRSTAAKSLCIWSAIEDAMHNGLIFDFEGSDIPDLEHFFRGWGSQLTPYFKVFKAKNLLFKLATMMKYNGYY